MIFGIVTPHLSNFFFIVIKELWRWYDRGFTKDERRTRLIFQNKYENLYTHIDFLLEFRFSQILINVFIIMMYSPGVPLLYAVGSIIFFLTYWVDKIICKL